MLFPPELHAAIARSAREELRSFTAEVCKRLRDSLRRELRARTQNEAAPDAGDARDRKAMLKEKVNDRTRRTATAGILSTNDT
jgi:hypothetical protein